MNRGDASQIMAALLRLGRETCLTETIYLWNLFVAMPLIEPSTCRMTVYLGQPELGIHSHSPLTCDIKDLTGDLSSRLLSQTFTLISEGHIKPIFPREIFSFGDIVGAFRHMRGGSHIGKIVISDGPDRSIKVPVCSALSLVLLTDPNSPR